MTQLNKHLKTWTYRCSYSLFVVVVVELLSSSMQRRLLVIPTQYQFVREMYWESIGSLFVVVFLLSSVLGQQAIRLLAIFVNYTKNSLSELKIKYWRSWLRCEVVVERLRWWRWWSSSLRIQCNCCCWWQSCHCSHGQRRLCLYFPIVMKMIRKWKKISWNLQPVQCLFFNKISDFFCASLLLLLFLPLVITQRFCTHRTLFNPTTLLSKSIQWRTKKNSKIQNYRHKTFCKDKHSQSIQVISNSPQSTQAHRKSSYQRHHTLFFLV